MMLFVIIIDCSTEYEYLSSISTSSTHKVANITNPGKSSGIIELQKMEQRKAFTMANVVATLLVLMIYLPSTTCFHPSHTNPREIRNLFFASDSRHNFLFGSSGSGDDNIGVNINQANIEEQTPIESLAQQLADSQFKNIVVLVGAGMSVSAGIPDFRTPGTGLYSLLAEFELPYPEAMFELDYFIDNPKPFVTVAKSIWPGQEDGPKPTMAHSFVALLEKRGLLKRVYTQNVDGLERLAGVSDDKLLECHGHFTTASCTSPACHRKRDIDPLECQETYLKGETMRCPDCDSLVKPDIVFFGEELPPIFMESIDDDMEDCDLLVVMGTSLLVAPVATIPHWVGPKVPRLLINRELVGAFAEEALIAKGGSGYSSRDIFLQGDCDDGVLKVCELVGNKWVEQVKELHDDTQR